MGIIETERALEIKPEEFAGVGVRHPLWGLMRWYFKSRNAICFTTGISIRRNMGKQYTLEWDHIFPYSRLKEIGYGQEDRLKYALAQEITNRAVLTKIANRTKFTTDANGYLTEVKLNYPNALALQCIPEDDRLWERDHYEEFLKERRKILALELNHFLENITLSRESSIGVSLDELIAEGESNELEFKSSLRWSYKEGAINKKLEEVIVKSISAFSNGEGGTILIGVDDNGEILGLEHDYTSLSGTRDEFELHLRNVINSTFGVSFAATNLIITFPEVSEHEICRIGIKHGTAPCYVTVSGVNGLKSEKLYVRSGNSSIEVPLSEVAGYVETRFRK